MISDLLDLADRLRISTPFERMPVHYVIDIDNEGKILGITPAYASTKENGGDAELGKVMECPAYFPLAVGQTGEIQAAGGGGKSVAEAGHGDVREIFCTDFKVPRGGSPMISAIEKPNRNNARLAAAEIGAAENGDLAGGPDDDDDFGSDSKKTKNQYYRYDGWLRRIGGFADQQLAISGAQRKFIDSKPRLTDPAIIGLFSIPDPAQAEMGADSAEDRKKAKDAATKARNAALTAIADARFTFRISGELLLKNRDFRAWWNKVYADERERLLEKLPNGSDGFLFGEDTGSKRFTPVFPHVPGVPGGGTYCPLASFDKAPTKSFGLGKHTLSMSLATAERAAAALKWLLRDKGHSCSLGKKLVAVFWAVPAEKNAAPCPHNFAAMLNEPDALAVRKFFSDIHGHAATAPDAARFYCALLSSPKARIAVRSWHTQTLVHVEKSVEAYFRAVSLPNLPPRGGLAASTIGEMAAATVAHGSESPPPPAIYSRIIQMAFFGTLAPHSFLVSALARQASELAKRRAGKKERSDFESRLRARTALIKLYFYSNHKEKKDRPMDEQHHDQQDHPAYLCGRVLALLDNIHNAAHGRATSSSPAGRYYGSASSTPALVFPRLCKLANVHLHNIAGGLAYKLQFGVPKEKSATTIEHDFDGLAQLIARFAADAAWPRTLSLEDQGRFAIGFYYEKCRKWPRYRKGDNPRGDEAGVDDGQRDDTDNSTKS